MIYMVWAMNLNSVGVPCALYRQTKANQTAAYMYNEVVHWLFKSPERK